MDTALDELPADDDGEGVEVTESVYKLKPCSIVVFSSPVPKVEERAVLEAGKLPQPIVTEVAVAKA